MELEGKISRCRSQRDHPPQGSVLAPLIFNVYTNDQPIHPGTSSFVYADDLAINAQSKDVAPIEETLTSALVGLSEHYTTHQLRANPTKTQVSLFHVFFFFRVLHTMFSHLRARAFALAVTVARSSAVQASSSRRQERRWAIVCGSPQSNPPTGHRRDSPISSSLFSHGQPLCAVG